MLSVVETRLPARINGVFVLLNVTSCVPECTFHWQNRDTLAVFTRSVRSL